MIYRYCYTNTHAQIYNVCVLFNLYRKHYYAKENIYYFTVHLTLGTSELVLGIRLSTFTKILVQSTRSLL